MFSSPQKFLAVIAAAPFFICVSQAAYAETAESGSMIIGITKTRRAVEVHSEEADSDQKRNAEIQDSADEINGIMGRHYMGGFGLTKTLCVARVRDRDGDDPIYRLDLSQLDGANSTIQFRCHNGCKKYLQFICSNDKPCIEAVYKDRTKVSYREKTFNGSDETSLEPANYDAVQAAIKQLAKYCRN